MSAPIIRKEWFSAAELAALALPGVPRAKRKVNLKADSEGWQGRSDDNGAPLTRARAGRGGGLEYHVSLLPVAARNELFQRGLTPESAASNAEACCQQQVQSPAETAQDLWSWYAKASTNVKHEAERRLLILLRVDEAEKSGMTRSAAVSTVAISSSIAPSTVWNWIGRVASIPRSDWLPTLAPRFSAGARKTEIPAELWSFYESWWLRQSEPTHADTYRRTVIEAKRLGITILPSAKTFIRRAEQIPPEIVALKRKGPEAARLLVPAIERTVAGLHALQVVNADGHKWDVGVRFPDGSTGRVITVAIQDVYSRKFLAWRHGRSESATLVRLAFMDLFRNWGFPDTALLDNGRANASKWITGGAKNRYRYSIQDGDPLGMLPRFGIDVQWALPKRGSSKPIERGFRDFAQTIARHAAFDGAWLGNSVANKPENYGSRIIDYADFVKVIDAEIAEHNSRPGRETEMAKGRSFDQTFAESYASMPIRRATELQLHECMLSAEKVRAHRDTGAITFLNNRYWKPGMATLAGQQLVIRYDPENLHSEIHVYDPAGPLLLTAPIWEKSGFLTEDHGRARMKVERDLVKNARRDTELRNLLSAQELAHRMALASSETSADEIPPPKVVRMVRTRGVAVAAAAMPAPDFDREEYQRRTSAALETQLRLVRDQE